MVTLPRKDLRRFILHRTVANRRPRRSPSWRREHAPRTLIRAAVTHSAPPSIFVTRRLPEPVERRLVDEYGASLNASDEPPTPEALRRALRTHDIVLCTLTDRLDRETITASAGRCRLLANFGAGTDHIDLAAAAEAGMVVTNTPGVLTEDTADLAILLVLAAARRATEGVAEVRDGRWTGWRPTHLLGTRVSGASLGIVGMGRIGQAVAQRASAGFGMPVRYHSRRRASPDVEARCRASWLPSLHDLLASSDVVSLHCPATPATRHLIGAAELARMKPSAILVNTARGDVVDEAALVHALDTGLIAGAGLDVFEHEPAIPDALRVHPRVFALPHLGSATVASRVAMGECALRNIAAFLRGDDPPDRVR